MAMEAVSGDGENNIKRTFHRKTGWDFKNNGGEPRRGWGPLKRPAIIIAGWAGKLRRNCYCWPVGGGTGGGRNLNQSIVQGKEGWTPRGGGKIWGGTVETRWKTLWGSCNIGGYVKILCAKGKGTLQKKHREERPRSLVEAMRAA